MKLSSGIPYVTEAKVREAFHFQGKQFPYPHCHHLALVKRSWDPVTDLPLWPVHVPCWTQSLIQSLDAQGLFHDPAPTKHFLTSLSSSPQGILVCRSVVVVSQYDYKVL